MLPSSEKPLEPLRRPAPRETAPPSQPISWRKYLQTMKILPAFWTITGALSLIVNIILIAALIALGRQLFNLKYLVGDQLIGGLYGNFVKMDEAHIMTTILVSDTIQVNDTIPVVFNLPLKRNTEVTLVEDTSVKNATIYLNGQAVPLDLVLRKGTKLNISLDLTVPVDQRVPVVLNVPVQLRVPVDIPLDQTQLHEPFVGLQNVVEPYQGLLVKLPPSWEELGLCKIGTHGLCKWFFYGK